MLSQADVKRSRKALRDGNKNDTLTVSSFHQCHMTWKCQKKMNSPVFISLGFLFLLSSNHLHMEIWNVWYSCSIIILLAQWTDILLRILARYTNSMSYIKQTHAAQLLYEAYHICKAWLIFTAYTQQEYTTCTLIIANLLSSAGYTVPESCKLFYTAL